MIVIIRPQHPFKPVESKSECDPFPLVSLSGIYITCHTSRIGEEVARMDQSEAVNARPSSGGVNESHGVGRCFCRRTSEETLCKREQLFNYL